MKRRCHSQLRANFFSIRVVNLWNGLPSDVVSAPSVNAFVDFQAMLVWLSLPFYDLCGFRSVTVNSVYKLQFFFTFIAYIRDV